MLLQSLRGEIGLSRNNIILGFFLHSEYSQIWHDPGRMVATPPKAALNGYALLPCTSPHSQHAASFHRVVFPRPVPHGSFVFLFPFSLSASLAPFSLLLLPFFFLLIFFLHPGHPVSNFFDVIKQLFSDEKSGTAGHSPGSPTKPKSGGKRNEPGPHEPGHRGEAKCPGGGSGKEKAKAPTSISIPERP